MPRTARHVAAILAGMFVDHDQQRLRVTEKTLRMVGRRTQLRDVHKSEVRNILEDQFGLVFLESARGFSMFRLASLDGTRSWTFKAFRENTEAEWADEEAMWEYASGALLDFEDNDDDE